MGQFQQVHIPEVGLTKLTCGKLFRPYSPRNTHFPRHYSQKFFLCVPSRPWWLAIFAFTATIPDKSTPNPLLYSG
jgi:hypothetical protein